MGRRSLLFVTGIIALAATACGGGDGQGTTAVPSLGATPTITDPGQITLPTDAYMVTTAQIKQVTQAQDAVTAECMRGFGLTARPTLTLGLDDAPKERLTRSMLYGYFDVEKAKTHGYDRGSGMADQGAAGNGAGGTPPTAAEEIAMSGNDPTTQQPVPTLDGKPVPPGGCGQKGRDTLKADQLIISDAALPDGGPKIPAGDPRIVEAYAKWSECMKGKGFEYKDPIAAVTDPKWAASAQAGSTGPAGPDEIATATADVECKIANNTVGVVVAVQTAYGKKYVEDNSTKLTAYRQQIDDLVRKAAQITAGGQTG
ncbi:hypothetical protein OG625_26465 [Streptomyces sp. NBC_01351]|uniref:hypothetical protein n=1 Tax=Streptomyces sp. NBC_01351 TaxID=2903833 RepID=UPI002E303870|nr:hypothetical protein [Streptomyces sp. NBC_01351]